MLLHLFVRLTFSHFFSRRYRSAALSPSVDGFDRNAITPGTAFMNWLSTRVRLVHPRESYAFSPL
jgi:hypothetical protein